MRSGCVATALLAAVVWTAATAAHAGEMLPPQTSTATVDWDAAANAVPDRNGASAADVFARLNARMAHRFPDIAKSTVPVLLPVDPPAQDAASADITFGSFRPSDFFLPGPAGYHASFFLKEGSGLSIRYQRPVEIEMSGAAFVYDLDGPNIAQSETTPKGFDDIPGLRRILREAHVRYAFERFGVPYVVSIQCFDGRVTPRRLSCRDADTIATRFVKSLQVAGGTPGPSAKPPMLDLTRPQTVSQNFTYLPPGQLIANSGYRSHSGRTDYHVYAQIRFPLAQAPAFAKSQSFNPWGDCYKTGRVGRMDHKGAPYRCKRNDKPLVFDESAPENFSYPWRDNFCEARDTQVGQCPGGVGHQGQDIRPANCVLKNDRADRCEPYFHDVVAARDGMILRNPKHYTVYETAFVVTNTETENVRLRYLHMDPRHMDTDNIFSGRRVRQGEVIGKVGNFYKRERGTSYHLHFDTQVFTRDGWVWVNPYMTLVAAYERLIGARGTEVERDSVGPAVSPQVVPEQLIEQQASAKPKAKSQAKSKAKTGKGKASRKAAHKGHAKRGKRHR
ncbi:MAG: peptidoglycan DD-metalloendopeptidase family protein [Pseudolabrys sp.]